MASIVSTFKTEFIIKKYQKAVLPQNLQHIHQWCQTVLASTYSSMIKCHLFYDIHDIPTHTDTFLLRICLVKLCSVLKGTKLCV